MKKPPRLLLISTVISSMAAILNAQPYTDHTPRDGDRLHPGLADSRALIISVDDSTRTVTLSRDAVSYDDGSDASVYIDGDTISYVQSATKHRFLLHSDTLSYIGYENRASDFRLDRPVSMAVFPLSESASIREEWSGHLLQYGLMMLRHVRGISISLAQGGWTLVDGMDTVRNAMRLTWRLDMSYADPDSVDISMPDSVASGIISEMRVDPKAMLAERLLTERTMWFSDDARYPVLTDSRVSRIMLDSDALPKDTVPLTMLAEHYPASYQYSDTGEDIIAMRPDGYTRGNDYGPYRDGESDTGASLSVGDPEVNGETMTVTLGSPGGAVTATLTMFSDTGLMLASPVEVKVGTVPKPYRIAVPSGWSGVIMIRIDSGDESYTRKAII